MSHPRRKHREIIKNTSKLRLDRILGLTTTSSNTLAVSNTNDLIAYAAGAVIVIYNHKRNKQIAFLCPPPIASTTSNNANNIQTSSSPIVQPLGNNDLLASTNLPSNPSDEKKGMSGNARAKPISCLAFSPDGNYLAAGEMGHQPRIMIWNIKEKKLLREFKSHKFGVLSIAFSPNMRYLVSIGFQHDGYLLVWDWKKGVKLAGNKVTSRVNAVSFSKDGSYFVTAGLRHVKFWYMDAGRIPKKRNISPETQVLDGRSGILGVLRDANFVDVACDRSSDTGYTYFITDNGILCIFKAGRVIDKWVDLQVKSAFSIAVSSTYVVCTCSEGIVRLFEPVTLKYLGMLPKPHPLGIDISAITSPDMVRSSEERFPDVVAMVYDARSQRVISVYSDRSLYLWDIKDLNKIGKYRSFIFHSDCVWGVESCPTVTGIDDILTSTIPPHSFATFSGDGTIRIWNIDTPNTLSSTSSSPLTPPLTILMSPSTSTTVSVARRNIYSRELIKMLYVDPDAAKYAKLREGYECQEDQCTDFGIRSLKMSPDGSIMASGDRSGNLRVHNMKTWDMLTYQEAHDSEILSIDITTPMRKDLPHLIATGSRDRLLHIFDIKSNFQLVQSMDDHSSSITAVRFSEDSSKLISCGADKGLIFRRRTSPVTPFHDATPRPYTTYHHHAGRSTVFDMALDVNAKYVATVTGERRLFVFDADSGKPFRVCKPETADESSKFVENSGGSLMTIDLDPYSGTYAVTSGSDRCIRLFDLTNSTCIEKVCAHSELITDVKFIRTHSEEDGLKVISTSSDGIVLIWKITKEVVMKMIARAGSYKHKRVVSVEDRRAMMLGLQQQQQLQSNGRLRRLSSASNIRPTASISQMIRQNDRKTFSTVSSAEQRYDDVYKKISGRRPRVDTQEFVHPYQAYESPVDLTSADIIHIKPLEKTKSPTLRTSAASMNSPPKRSGKLDRLYNGLPTNGRERTYSQVSNPTFCRPTNDFLPFPQSNPAIMGRTNPVLLRRAISRDAIRKDIRKSPTMLSPPNNDLPRRKSQPQFGSRRSSDSSTPPDTDKNEGDTEDELDSTREEEEEDEDDEEEIIFTAEPDQTIPFEVSTHLAEEEDDGRNTPNSDQEPSTEEDESEDCDELRIEAREPPSLSISRTTSRRRSMLDKPAEDEKKRNRQSITSMFLSALTAPAEEPLVNIEEEHSDIFMDSREEFVDAQEELEEEDSVLETKVHVPVVEAKVPSVEANKSAVDDIVPAVEVKVPVLEVKVPAVEVNVPPVKVKIPVGEVSVVEVKPSLVEVKMTTADIKAPEADVNLPLEGPVEEFQVPTVTISGPSNDNDPEVPEVAEKEETVNDEMAGSATEDAVSKEGESTVLADELQDAHEKQEVMDKTETALADLKLVDILLESVLETYLSIPAHHDRALIETKLEQVVAKVTKVTQKETSPETLKLLEHYSSLLIHMVQNKINP